MADESPIQTKGVDAQLELLDVPLSSPALARLLDEVRDEQANVPQSYNRTYNRHNR